jgi:hypothetical protein
MGVPGAAQKWVAAGDPREEALLREDPFAQERAEQARGLILLVELREPGRSLSSGRASAWSGADGYPCLLMA